MDFSKLNKFDDIYAITEKMNKKTKGDLFELFTYHLFKLDPRLNNNLQKIWMYKDIPKNILKELSLPTKDKGIDLLAIINDQYYAIQCKFRQEPKQGVAWASLATFFGLSFGMNNKITGGFFVTNTTELCTEVLKSDKIVAIYGDYYDNIPPNFFQNINNKVVNYEKKNKLIHQTKCVYASFDHYILNGNNRGYIEMACGSGKTLTSYWIAKSIGFESVVIFVPSLQLLSQFYTDWINQSYAENNKINYLLIGSDADVSDEIKEKSNGLLLYTDPTLIRKFLQKNKTNMVVICTYQSSDKLAEACDKKIKFEFGIFDECHRTVGQKGKQFGQMLTDKEMTIDKRLFMTATPKIYKGTKKDIVSMDKEAIYGECFYTYNTGQAIADGRLTDYQILSIYATEASIRRDIKSNKLVQYKKEFTDTEAKYLGTILVILKKFHDGTINHLITYHSTIARASKFSNFLHKINKLIYGEEMYICGIDGNDPMAVRKTIITEFSEDAKGVLCSARVLNEGVNIPVVDSVCFVDGRDSTIDIVQCVGRALRIYEGKNIAYIIIPIFINDINNDFDNDEFGTIIRVLKALKSTDEGIAEYFHLRRNGDIYNRKVIVNEYYDKVNFSKEINIEEWESNIDGKIWKMVDDWNYKYNTLKEFVKTNNNKLPVEESKDATENRLGKWCSRQRLNKKNGKISNEKIKLLEEMDGWIWSRDDLWDNRLLELKKWIVINKKMPSQISKNIIEKSLGKWCDIQRQNKKSGTISNKRINSLGEIKEWFWSIDQLWNNRLLELKEYIRINNCLPSQRSKDPNAKSLGNWCATQRTMKNKGKLSNKRTRLLNKIKLWYRDVQFRKYSGSKTSRPNKKH